MEKALRLLVYIFIVSALATGRAAASVLPTPVRCDFNEGSFRIPPKVRICLADSVLFPAQEYMSDWLARNLDFTADKDSADIYLSLNPAEITSGAYGLEIAPGQIRIRCADYPGAINALSTLRQIHMANGGTLPCMTIADAPYFQWRGLMLDCARHFFTVEELERVLDMMALYKLNVFHWHLCDDQGWRAEIKRYPQLTGKGAWNPLNHLDRECMARAAAEDNPDFLLPADRLKVTAGSDTLYGGYYTQEQMRHIVGYAAARGISVMPELDVPGHSTTLTRVFPELSCDGEPVYEICIGAEKSLEIIQNIFAELLDIFPCRYIHIGGDEVDKSRWASCGRCRDLARKENLESTDDLQAWFNRRLELFFRNRGRIMTGWDEIAYNGLGAETAIMWWRGDERAVIEKATADGKAAICSDNSILYLNNLWTDDAIGRILSLDPRDGLGQSQRRIVNGIQAQLWTELIPTLGRAGYQLFPRLFAVAEAAWAAPANRISSEQFNTVADSQYRNLSAIGFNYALPEIEGIRHNNVFIHETTVAPVCPSSEATVRYTTDGSIPTIKSRRFKKPLTITRDTELCVATFRRDGSRSDFIRASFDRRQPRPAMDVNPHGKGLKVRWHRNAGVRRCAQIDSMPLIKELYADRLSLPLEVDGSRAIIFKGYFYAPVTGVYDLTITSDDGSTVDIDGALLIDNDGYHGPIRRQAQTALGKGWHSLEVRYFDYNDGGGFLEGSIKCADNESLPIILAH